MLRSPHPLRRGPESRSRPEESVPVTVVSEAPSEAGARASQPAGVVVTGAAQGLGKAIAQRFAGDGAAVVAVDLSAQMNEVVAALGAGHDAVVGDAGDPANLRRACERAVEL